MRISRIHTDLELRTGACVSLPAETAHYLANVLRLQNGAAVILFNGDGMEYHARLNVLKKNQVSADLLSAANAQPESPLRSLLGLGISRGDRMDYAIQKATELGVSEIFPLLTEHSEVRLKGERQQKRLAHWQKVSISACEQCGRNRPPKVHEAMTLENWLPQVQHCEMRLVFDQSLENKLGNVGECREVVLLTGPEGGFSAGELALAKQQGFRGIQLGPRVLRTETAPVAALAILQFLWGDWQA